MDKHELQNHVRHLKAYLDDAEGYLEKANLEVEWAKEELVELMKEIEKSDD